MGAVASVFEAIARRCPEYTPNPWTKDVNEQRRLVLATRRALGLDWNYEVDCNVDDHNQRRVTPAQTATYRDATVITIPETQASSIGEKITEFFESPEASDLSIPGQTICPHCAAGTTITMCSWTLLPCTPDNAPDRLFFRSFGVFAGNYGQSPTPSLSLTFGAEYSLVGISYHLPTGLSSERNHFTSQFRSRGRWIKYDCLDGGITSSSPEFNPSWNQAFIHMVVYLKTSLIVATPPPSERDPSPPSSPSEWIASNEHNMGTVQDELDSPSGRNNIDEETSYRYIFPLSPSGRMEHDDYWTPLHRLHYIYKN